MHACSVGSQGCLPHPLLVCLPALLACAPTSFPSPRHPPCPSPCLPPAGPTGHQAHRRHAPGPQVPRGPHRERVPGHVQGDGGQEQGGWVGGWVSGLAAGVVAAGWARRTLPAVAAQPVLPVQSLQFTAPPLLYRCARCSSRTSAWATTTPTCPPSSCATCWRTRAGTRSTPHTRRRSPRAGESAEGWMSSEGSSTRAHAGHV
jgi:hypothetical protein